MKTFLPVKKTILRTLSLIAALFFMNECQAQYDLVFHNAHVRSGQEGADHTVYTFPLVNDSTDAHVRIMGRSSSLVTLENIDNTGTGYDGAFQPQVKYNGGSTSGASSWWMEFEIKFVKANTTSQVTIPNLYTSSFNIDGDNNTLSEYNIIYGSSSYTLDNITNIVVSNFTGNLSGSGTPGKKFDGTTVSYPGFDTLHTNIMVTTNITDVSILTVRVGATTTGSSTETNRTYGIWFKNIVFPNPQTTLPVVLESFTASLLGQNTNLKWSTASESNLGYFSVERSTDGIHFSQAGMVLAVGNTSAKTNYGFTDNVSGIQAPVIYYRLNMVDADGKSRYSDIRTVKLSGTGDNKIIITTYPNPVVNTINVTIPAGWQNHKVVYEIFSANGNRALQNQVTESSQTETLNMSNMSPGIYIVKASCNGQAAIQKIIKQ